MTDDEYLIGLLRLLDDEPSKPSRVDLVRAIAEARRRRRTRRIVGASGAAALAVVVVAAFPATFQGLGPGPGGGRPAGNAAAPASAASPGTLASRGTPANAGASTGDPAASPVGVGPGGGVAPASPPTRCTVERLPIPGGHPMSLVTGADPSGRFLLGRSYPDRGSGSYPILIWDNGKATSVKLPGDDQHLTDATSTGTAVGSGWNGEGPLPYLVRDGRVTRLKSNGAAQARAINEAGQIVGSQGDRRPVLWPSADAAPVELRLPGPGWHGEAVDIDEDGTVVGVVSADGRTEQAQIWYPDGTGKLLANPEVAGERTASFRPQTIRNGWVTGLAGSGSPGGGENVPVRFRLKAGGFVPFPRNEVWPQNGNGQGWVVGSTPDGRPALLTDAGTILLPELDNRRHETANLAWTVSDDGRTVGGQSDNAKGNPQAVRWRCR